MKKVLLINDLSCVGKCSLTVSIPIISSFGIETIPLPTCILSNQTYFKDYIISDFDKLEAFTKLWQSQNITFDTIYTGFFKNHQQIDYLCEYLKKLNCTLFVDPILGDNGKRFSCFDDNYQRSLINLSKMADYITPNLTESCLLTNSKLDENPINIIKKFSNDKVVITGIEKENKIGYLVKDKNIIFYILKDRVSQELHGTGDVFSSFLCAKMILSNNFSKSVIEAADLTEEAIKNTIKEKDHSVYGLNFENII